MLSRVFESSKNLDDVALHHLIDALCKLSNEAMELAYSNRVSLMRKNQINSQNLGVNITHRALERVFNVSDAFQNHMFSKNLIWNCYGILFLNKKEESKFTTTIV